MNRVFGKGFFENVLGWVLYDNVYGCGFYGVILNDSLERVGLGFYGDFCCYELYEYVFGMKFNDRKFLGNVVESVIKKVF